MNNQGLNQQEDPWRPTSGARFPRGFRPAPPRRRRGLPHRLGFRESTPLPPPPPRPGAVSVPFDGFPRFPDPTGHLNFPQAQLLAQAQVSRPIEPGNENVLPIAQQYGDTLDPVYQALSEEPADGVPQAPFSQATLGLYGSIGGRKKRRTKRNVNKKRKTKRKANKRRKTKKHR